MSPNIHAPADKADKERLHQLFVSYQSSRDKKYRDEIVASHMNLVRYLAGRFANRGEAQDDLMQVGSMGLIKAIERYDLTRGVEFATYATPTIVGEIKRHFRDKGWAFKVPRRLQELSMSINRALDVLVKDLGRSPTIAEIARHLGLSAEEVLEAQELGQVYNTVSLNSDLNGEDDRKVSNMLDFLGREDFSLETVENQMVLERALSALTRREQLVIFLRFYEGLSQSEIAKHLKISQMHVSRLQQRALEKLRQELTALLG